MLTLLATALVSDEVPNVVAALHEGGVTVAALHNHMLEDVPRTFHLHAWAVGDPEEIAETVRAALDQMANR